MNPFSGIARGPREPIRDPILEASEALMTTERSADEPPLLCHRCVTPLGRGGGEFFIVRIEAFADPTPPVLDDEGVAHKIRREIEQLKTAMEGLSERELTEQVHRRLTLHLCNGCYRRWIEDPTG